MTVLSSARPAVRPRVLGALAGALAGALIWAAAGPAAAACQGRGDLDERYCDDDGDLVADAPRDANRWLDPGVIRFAYGEAGDPPVYETIFRDFMDHLAAATGRPVRWRDVGSDEARIEALRRGRLHIAGLPPGRTVAAVNRGGFRPVAVMGRADGAIGERVVLVTRAGTGIRRLADLKGRTLAHVTPSSYLGDQAPRALFAARGLAAGRDYRVVFSGRHANSVRRVAHGEVDAAPVAASVLRRLAGAPGRAPLRVVWESLPFPGAAFGYVHDLHPDLKRTVETAFASFEWKGTRLERAFAGSFDRFLPAAYAADWADVRTVERAAAGAPRAR